MKRFALTTAIALGLAAPALAQDISGDYTGAQRFVLEQLAQDDEHIRLNHALSTGNEVVSTQGIVNDRAADIFAQLLAEDDEHYRVAALMNDGSEVVSTQGIVNDRAAAIFAQLRAEEDGLTN